ncbi:MAG: hypothetical protein JO360_02090 [Acidobacteria bacterium]|nr:hypothetical protein [Acidobacteriota bacterium]
MSTSRREFIRAGSLLALSAGLSLGLAKATLSQRKGAASPRNDGNIEIPQQSKRDPIFHMSRQTFTPYLNTTFLVDPGYRFPLETELVKVTDLRSATDQQRNAPGKDCFVLTFKINGEETLKQGTYQIRHDALGVFELFLVPTANKQGELFFEATFNRNIP